MSIFAEIERSFDEHRARGGGSDATIYLGSIQLIRLVSEGAREYDFAPDKGERLANQELVYMGMPVVVVSREDYLRVA